MELRAPRIASSPKIVLGAPTVFLKLFSRFHRSVDALTMKLSTDILQLALCLVYLSVSDTDIYNTHNDNSKCDKNSLSNGIRPPEPPGFATKMYYHAEAGRLSPIGVYLLAVTYFHAHQRWAWTLPLYTDAMQERPDIPVTLIVKRVKASAAETPVLNNGHVLLGIYAAVDLMSKDSSFLSTKVDVSLHGTTIGRIFLTARQLPRIENGALNTSAPASTASTSPIINSSSANSDSGTFVDPAYPSDILYYTFSDRRIKSHDIFTCILEAFMILTYDDKTIPFFAFNAVSATGNLALNVHASDEVRITYNGVGWLLRLLASLYVRKKRFDEIEFTFRDESMGRSVKQAEGFFLRVGNGGLIEGADIA
ncbi:MAG: hypothetical protein Q9208_007571 [Pyrenodesmia sp. 3 TL-2023]